MSYTTFTDVNGSDHLVKNIVTDIGGVDQTLLNTFDDVNGVEQTLFTDSAIDLGIRTVRFKASLTRKFYAS